jgi:YVTN family beta-propeller protein
MYARRRMVVLAAALGLVVLVSFAVSRLAGGGEEPRAAAAGQTISPTSSPSPTTTPTRTTTAPSAIPASQTSMHRVRRITGNMSPKSVVASQDGQVFAQNMMYTHTVSVFDASGRLVTTIPDSVTLSDYGVGGHPGVSRGAPVEMAFSPDNEHAWVSNYSMYGVGFGPEGLDTCHRGDGTDRSFVYEIDTSTYKVERVVRVGSVPKYVATTPDGRYVLVTNWCSWDLSVIDAAKAKQVARIALPGAYPRGIAVTKDSRTAYVALMGSDQVVSVDLESHEVHTFSRPGGGPRHIVLAPDGKYLYVTNNRAGTVVKVSTSSGRVVDSVSTGQAPRSMAISADGTAVYVVNYESSTVTKLRTKDMKVLETDPTDGFPIGITYEPTKHRVWVACYGGSILVYDDSKPRVA